MKFIKKIKKFLKKYPNEGKEISIDEVRSLEKNINKTFPTFYQEFLLISGAFFDPIKMDHYFEFSESRNKKAKENLKKYSIILEKDIWVISEIDNSMFILFFYFNDGDNPPIYRLDFHYFENILRYNYEMEEFGELFEAREIEKDYEYLEKQYDSFSDYINERIKMYESKYD